MSTKRRHSCYTTKQSIGTNGKPACLECGGDVVAARRSTFCGKACSDSFYLKSRPDFARLKVFERDKGVCAKCSTDTLAGLVDAWKRSRGTGHLWQADHIVPVVEGGGLCGLENFRTLCTKCHKEETAALRRRMAEALRPNKQLTLDELRPPKNGTASADQTQPEASI